MTTQTETAPVLAELRVADRCDGCSAQALHRVAFTLDGTTDVKYLDFCGHHFSKSSSKLNIVAHLEASEGK